MYIEMKFLPRFCDTDANGHINNTAVAEWFECGRADLAYRQMSMQRGKKLLLRVDMVYRKEMNHLNEVTVRTGIERVGNSSVTLHQEIWQNGECGASATCYECYIDGKGGSSPVPDDHRAIYEAYLYGKENYAA